jgi:peptidoglycan hydrolase-like protein with peptidoglycan-binding domain
MNPILQRLQEALKQLGYLPPDTPLAVDDKPDERTREAIRLFQLVHRITVTGDADQNTLGQALHAVQTNEFVVYGYVEDADGPMPGVAITIEDRDLGSSPWQQLGTDRTTPDGLFSVWYPLNSFAPEELRTRDGLATPDLIFSLQVPAPGMQSFALYRMPENQQVTGDDLELGLQGRRIEQIRIVVESKGQRVIRGASEYEKLLTAFSAVWPRRSPGDLDEQRLREITFVARELEEPFSRVEALSHAFHWAAHEFHVPPPQLGPPPPPDLQPEVFYGLVRSSSKLATLESICTARDEDLKRGLLRAIESRIIPILSERELDDAIGRIVAAGPALATTVRPVPGLPTFAERIKAGVPKTEDQAVLLKVFAQNRTDPSTFWSKLRGEPEFAAKGKLEAAQFALQLDALTQSHLPLMKVLQAEELLTSTRDLLRLGEEKLRQILNRGDVGVPDDVPGANPTDRRENYLESVMGALHLALPTDSVALSLGRIPSETLGGDDVRDAVDTFFSNAISADARDAGNDFDVRHTDFEKYIADNGDAVFSGVADKDRKAATAQIARAQRLFRVSTGPKAFETLMTAGFHSARDIAYMPRETFVQKFGDSLGPQETMMLHTNAVTATAATMHLYVTIHDVIRGVNPDAVAVGDPDGLRNMIGKHIPDWQDLFGAPELCSCMHCRSVYSPAAYLVDLLHFLGQSGTNAGGLTPLDVLIGKDGPSPVMGRRPDLAHLKLTCENTNTALPYLDLVNEVLENIALSWATAAEKDGRIGADANAIEAHDTGSTTTPELKASPQFVLDEAYHTPGAAKARDRPDRALWPIPLPYDESLEAGRVYLEYLGLPLVDLIAEFSKTSDMGAELAEALHISSLEYALLTETNLDGSKHLPAFAADDLYGYTPELLPLLQAGDTSLYVAALKRKLNSGGAALPIAADPAAEKFDASVTAAVTALQTANGLTPNGKVGVAEWRVLQGADPEISALLLPAVRELLPRTGLTYEELVSVCKMRFLNPERPTFDILQQLAVPEDDVLAWIKAGLAGDPGAKITAALAEAGVPKVDFVSWASDHLKDDPWDRLKNSLVLEAPSDAPCNLDKTRLRHWDPDHPELEAAEWRLLNRTIRLWRKLGWSVNDLDRVLTALGATNITSEVVAQIALVLRLQAELGLSADEVALLFATPDPAVAASFYQKRFLSRAALRNDPAFAPDWKGDVLATAKISDHEPALLAGLRLKAPYLDDIRADASPAGSNDLTIEALGKLARYAIVARAVGIRVPDFVALRQLSGMNPFSPPAPHWAMQAFLKLVRLLQNSDVSVPQLDYVFRGGADHPVAPDAAAVETALQDLNTTLLRLAADYALVDDPHGEITRVRLNTVFADPKLVDRFIKMIDGSAVYSTALAALPAGFVWPAAFQKRFTFDAAGVLSVRGALTESDRLLLRGLAGGLFPAAIDVLAAAPRKALADLLAGEPSVPVSIPSGESKLVDTSSFDAQGQVDPAAVAQKFSYVLTNILPILHEAARRSAIIQKLSEALTLTPENLSILIEESAAGVVVLHAIGAPAEPMIADFFEPINVAFAKRSWLRLHKAALLLDSFKPSAAELTALAKSIFNFEKLPDTAPGAYDPAAFLQYGELAQYIVLKRSLPASATPLAAVFTAVNVNAALDILAAAAGIAPERLQSLAGAQGFALAIVDLQHPPAIARLLEAANSLNRLGIAPDQAFQWASDPVTQTIADDIKRAARATTDDATWLGIAKKLNDPLREGRRDALVAYLLPRLGFDNRSGLYEHLLIDIDMNACMMTSRIKQAAASVQLFTQQILLNLVPGMPPSVIDREQWDWMHRYRVWEANRKIFLYPENWIEPELRDAKTPFFTELESELLQTDVTDANVEKALLNYLEKLDSVAKLRMCGICVQTDFDPAEKLKQVVHLFGHTLNTPFSYLYRRYEVDANDVATWTPWEKVPVDVRGDQVAPAVFNRRLYLFWSVIATKADEPAGNSGRPEPPEKYDELSIAWSEYVNGKWSPKYVSDPQKGLRLNIHVLLSKRRLDAYPSGDSLSVVYTAPEIHGIDYNPGVNIFGAPTPARSVTEYVEKAEGSFDFDNCHGTLTLNVGKWSQHSTSGFGVNPFNIQPLGNGTVDVIETLTRNTSGALITEQHMRHIGKDYFTYEDSSRTYFGYVEPKWRSTGGQFSKAATVQPDLSRFGELLNKPYDVVTDLGQPYFSLAGESAAMSSNSWATATAAMGRFSLQSRTPAAMRVIDAPADGGLIASAKNVSYSVIGDYSSYLRSTDAAVRYEILYHPFTCAFISGLRRFGVPGLLNLSNQQLELVETFAPRYAPTSAVTKPYPVEQVDFGRIGTTSVYRSTAYSAYNWELFFHVPLLLAVRLSENQRFEEAMKWFHYVFNPTDGAGGYWKVLPFRTTPKENIEQLLTRLNAGDSDVAKQVSEWRGHPFQPHLIARMRLIAYQKYVVMKYIDNLIAWGDQLFGQDTIESINEATQLYVLFSALLGRRPEKMPSRGESAPATFADLRTRLDAFSNAMVNLENRFPSYSASSPAAAKDAAGLLGVGRSLYFCIPQNDKLLGYWDTVEDRLFKIRNCMNLQGIVRELPLFEPPIDPALLVRAAARGIDLGSVLSDLNSPAPFYRFTHMLQKALDVCGDLKSLGAQLLAALERRDAEQLALLRQQQEGGLLALVRLVREKQLADAQAAVDALLAQRRTIVAKYQYFQALLGAESGPAPEEGAEIPFVSARRKASSAGGAHLIEEESNELGSAHSARDWQVRSATTETLGNVLHYIPNLEIKNAPLGTGLSVDISIGGAHAGPAAAAIARYQKNLGDQDSYDAATFKRMAEYTRREQQWSLESNTTAGEIMQVDKQLIGLRIRADVAGQELKNLDRQIENSAALETAMREKYTNQELYSWMIGQISAQFFRSYQLAYDLARKAERAFQFELGLTNSDFIRFGTWDSLRKGLMCGEQLLLQLRQLDRAWHERNRREFEITKHVSLVQLDPQALVQLKMTGKCEFEVPEVLFDLDFPGHYFRRLRSVSVSIPCVLGPYTSVSATLTLLHHRVRTDARATVAYPEQQGEDEMRFLRDFVPMQSIATSNANNDSGVFELNFRDERYLPFEGAGAISRWRLELPHRDLEHPEKSLAQFDYDTITDVLLHLKYTARDGGDALKTKVTDSLKQTLNELHEIAGEQGLLRLFSLRSEFPAEWRRTRAHGTPLTIDIPKNRFPFLVQGRKITVEAAFQLTGPDKATKLTDPVFVPADNLWKLGVTPSASDTDMLVVLVYTIN